MWPRSKRRRGSVRCGALMLGCVLAGCAVGPEFVRPPPPKVTHYSPGADPVETVAAQGRLQRFSTGGAVAADWWRLFESPQLDAVITEALHANPGLQAAEASLRQSEHTLRSGYGIFFPQAEAHAAATRERFAPQTFGENARRQHLQSVHAVGLGELRPGCVRWRATHDRGPACAGRPAACHRAGNLHHADCEHRQHDPRRGRLPRGDRSDR